MSDALTKDEEARFEAGTEQGLDLVGSKLALIADVDRSAFLTGVIMAATAMLLPIEGGEFCIGFFDSAIQRIEEGTHAAIRLRKPS